MSSIEDPNITVTFELTAVHVPVAEERETTSEVPHPSTAMVGMLPSDRTRAEIDETTRALDIEARVICSRAANLLEEQLGVVMGEREEEMEALIVLGNFPSLFPLFACVLGPLLFHHFSRVFEYGFIHAIGEGSSSLIHMDTERSTENAALTVVPETPDDSSFELVPLPILMKPRKDSLKMMLSGVIHTVALYKLD